MLWQYANYCCLGYFLLSLILCACAGYVSRVNVNRAADDPRKKETPAILILITPVTWPFLALAWLFRFTVKAVFYGVFLISFTMVLVIYRNSPMPPWLKNAITKVGNKVLEGNSFLISILGKEWIPQST